MTTKFVAGWVSRDENAYDAHVATERPFSQLDDIDTRIVEAFRTNGRLSNSEAARVVGVSEATVRRRVDRLVDRRILKFAALTDPRMLGLTVEALIGLNVEPGSLESVGRSLAKMEEVRFLGLAMGALDVLVVARFPSLDAWLGFRSAQLGQIPGIQRVETFQIVKVLKRTYDWIFEEPGVEEETRLPKKRHLLRAPGSARVQRQAKRRVPRRAKTAIVAR